MLGAERIAVAPCLCSNAKYVETAITVKMKKPRIFEQGVNLGGADRHLFSA